MKHTGREQRAAWPAGAGYSGRDDRDIWASVVCLIADTFWGSLHNRGRVGRLEWVFADGLSVVDAKNLGWGRSDGWRTASEGGPYERKRNQERDEAEEEWPI